MNDRAVARAPLHILLATCNGARFLPALLDSLLAQSDPDWIVLARDDRSDDGTCALLQDFAARDTRLRLLRGADPRLGIRGNFERLLAAARDEPSSAGFLLCDQDDLWYPDKLARMRAALEHARAAHGDGAPLLAYADLALIDAAARPLAASHFDRAGAPQLRRGVDRWLLAHNLIPGCAMAGNRALLDAVLPFPSAVFHHDWWLLAVAAVAGHVVPVDAVLTGYRQHSDNAIGAASPARRAVGFMLRFGPSLDEARAQYARAVGQAGALVERLEGRGDARWLDFARSARDGLGAPRCWARAGAVIAGPVRRVGPARNALMLLAALFPLRPVDPSPPRGHGRGA